VGQQQLLPIGSKPATWQVAPPGTWHELPFCIMVGLLMSFVSFEPDVSDVSSWARQAEPIHILRVMTIMKMARIINTLLSLSKTLILLPS